MIEEVPAGRYRVSASRRGFVTLAFGQRHPYDAPRWVDVRRGVVERVTLALPRAAVIAGTVFDDHGEPLTSSRVEALRVRLGNGERELEPIASTTTNDLGEFRLFGLAHGEYYVAATAPDARDGARVFFPSAPAASEAQRIRVSPGAQVWGTDIHVLDWPAGSIEGTLVDSRGRPASHGVITVRLDEERPGRVTGSARRGHIDRGGRFRIEGLELGRYAVAAVLPVSEGGASEELAAAHVQVDGPAQDIHLLATEGATLVGQVESEGGALPGASLAVVSVPVGASAGLPSRRTRVDGTGRFTLGGLAGRQRIHVERLPPGWAVTAVRSGGHDTGERGVWCQPGAPPTGVRIVVSNRLSRVTVVVRDGRGRAVDNATVLLFDADDTWPPARFDTMRLGQVEEGGEASFVNLRPGAYLAAAFEWLDPALASDLDFLATVASRAKRVTVHAGALHRVELPLHEAG